MKLINLKSSNNSIENKKRKREKTKSLKTSNNSVVTTTTTTISTSTSTISTKSKNKNNFFLIFGFFNNTTKHNNKTSKKKLQQQQLKEEQEKVFREQQENRVKKRNKIIQFHSLVANHQQQQKQQEEDSSELYINYNQKEEQEEELQYKEQLQNQDTITTQSETTNNLNSEENNNPSPLVQDLKIEDYYNLTTTQVPNSQFLHRLDSRMVGILSEQDIDKCKDVIPKDQTFITGFSLLLLTHSTTTSSISGTSPSSSLGNLSSILTKENNNNNNNNNSLDKNNNGSNRKIRTYSTSPVALLLSDKSAFIVLYDTRSQSIQQIETCDLIEIREIQTGYIHTPSQVDSDESVFMSNKKKSGQFSMRILKIYGGSWTLMPYSPTDSIDILKERVLSIAVIIRSLIQNSKLSHTIEAKLDNSEKFHIPIAYYQPKPDVIVEGEVYFNLKKFSFIQTKNDMKFKNIINYKREDYSFSIELLTVYECSQSHSTVIDGYNQLSIQSQGKSSNQSYLLYLPRLEIDQITRNIIRLVTESQDIVDQIVLDDDIKDLSDQMDNANDEIYNEQDILTVDQQSSSSSTTKTTTPSRHINKQYPTKVLGQGIKESDFYIIESEDDYLNNSPLYESTGPIKNIFISDQSTNSMISSEDQLWLQSNFPMRHKTDEFELVYSTSKHGISIRTFYSKLQSRSPCVMIIKDDRHNLFGAFTSDPWSTDSNVHYGSGETFLFKLSPERKKFSWTRENEYFMLSKDSFLSLGSGKTGAGFGLWIDEDLLYGSSAKCETFNNEILSYSSDFKILEIEVWSSVSSKNQLTSKKQTNATDFFGTSYSYKPPPRTSVYSNYRGSGY
ncbi:TLDc domain-containing protein [Tieghemostelium lacteum]|uniref:TLDc domain-containing protein n=1 Tax=Tieghemostelium lacteum TaxID=361077 RepID=A0A151ZJG5_TIELA|nr:TLDc domain-containing protein [Tieghemostelium lacteum]|eukprot:KYQ94067.1 TLDc domain-containing protein [Tieghemostelium lacteum]